MAALRPGADMLLDHTAVAHLLAMLRARGVEVDAGPDLTVPDLPADRLVGLVAWLHTDGDDHTLTGWAGDEPAGPVVHRSGRGWAAAGPLGAQLGPFAAALSGPVPAWLDRCDRQRLHAAVDALPDPDLQAPAPDGTLDNRRAPGQAMASNPLFVGFDRIDRNRFATAVLADSRRPPHSGPVVTVALDTLRSVQLAVARPVLHHLVDHLALLTVPARVLAVDGRHYLADGTHRAVVARLAGADTIDARTP